MTSPFSIKHFAPTFGSPPLPPVKAYWFIFRSQQLLLCAKNSGDFTIPCLTHPPVPQEQIIYSRTIGTYRGLPCIAGDWKAEFNLAGSTHSEVSLREAYTLIGDDFWGVAGRAAQVLHWHRTNKYCGRCGSQLREDPAESVKSCKQCGTTAYPRLSPAVIMSVNREDAILLGRAPRFPDGMYSTLAGYVEPGETLENAVKREVREEVGIEVGDIKYIASQPWPFPHSLMIGFSCTYRSGEIIVNSDELEDARWFSRHNLPRLPSRLSVARLLIDRFLAQQPDG